jgi:hypothetical protein
LPKTARIQDAYRSNQAPFAFFLAQLRYAARVNGTLRREAFRKGRVDLDAKSTVPSDTDRNTEAETRRDCVE